MIFFKHNWKLRKSYNGIYRTVFLIMYHFIISTNISTRFPNYNQWKIYWREHYNDSQGGVEKIKTSEPFLLIWVKGVCQLFAIFLTLRISWSSCFSHIQYFSVCNFLKVKYKIGNWRYFKAHAYCNINYRPCHASPVKSCVTHYFRLWRRNRKLKLNNDFEWIYFASHK